MNETTRAALEASIAHWKENAAATDRDEVRTGVGSCALCRIHWTDNCDGCPVAVRTDQSLCRGTPWEAAKAAWDRWMFADSDDAAPGEAFRAAAREEVAFLESLRE